MSDEWQAAYCKIVKVWSGLDVRLVRTGSWYTIEIDATLDELNSIVLRSSGYRKAAVIAVTQRLEEKHQKWLECLPQD